MNTAQQFSTIRRKIQEPTPYAIDEVNPHIEFPFIRKRNVYMEQEWTVRHPVQGAIPMERATLYKTDQGQFYLSHQDPMHNQLQNGQS